MRARDRRAVAVLRTTLAAIDNAEALPLSAAGDGPVVGRSADVARRELDEQRILAVVRAELRERVEAAALYARLDRPDEVAALHAEMRLLLAHLPEE
ncbi:MAG: GatB/YqeY domain-containing protein [Egibacteraceae bacterium]